MRNTFLYLFIFSVLFNIFQYVNSKKILESKDVQLTKCSERLTTSRDSIKEIFYDDIFDIKKDENAQDYFFNRKLDYKLVTKKVYEAIMELNASKMGNKLVPYEPINNKPFLINSMKFLNNRWVIAEFSNGDLWGQVLIKYFHNEDKASDLETVETILYDSQKAN